MSNIYQQVLEKLLEHFTHAQRAALQLLVQRLGVAAGGIDRLGQFKVLVAHGGGSTSGQCLALVRAAQLSVAVRHPGTFQLRVATYRHSGMGRAVMENIERGYAALSLHDDPRVELLVLDDQQVHPYDPLAPLSAATRLRNRTDLLVNGHLSGGDGRTSLCHGCYLGRADFYQRAMTCNGGVQAMVSAQSPMRQRRYLAWGLRVARQAGLGDRGEEGSGDSALDVIGRLGEAYYRQMYGEKIGSRRLPRPRRKAHVHWVHMDDLLAVAPQQHWRLLVEFLGFRFSAQALGFSETACANPLLMAHLRGLRAERVQQRTYAEGVEEYLQAAPQLMTRKGMPDHLVDLMLSAYDDPHKLQERRVLANEHGQANYQVSEEQLTCLLFSPFVDGGKGLAGYLVRCHPECVAALAPLHQVLQGSRNDEPMTRWLVTVSGLPIQALRRLYSQRGASGPGPQTLIARLRAGDPDGARVQLLDPVTGQTTTERVCGR
ncbi:hypothetical protein PMM47T1_15286 [Pseudomonas sp. M47T1]|uniref:hypothetical protein n=1 Tax=Pseudomonas sp. M47T1 TaxID=1179778 RepID=UPI00026075BD|nr:hypothetical protein [Pseudomonas sp. M47T1]EIK95761.1 hypothetical protein PMM47T1_15286 [Pseudomonas sp. M47T1]